MTTNQFSFRCKAKEFEHCCGSGCQFEHPAALLQAVKTLIKVSEGLHYTGTIKSTRNSLQIQFDFADRWLSKIRTAGWDCGPLPTELRGKLKVDAVLLWKQSKLGVEIEKANPKTIWLDFMKLLYLIKSKETDFCLLVVPKNYAHKMNTWENFKIAQSIRNWLREFISPKLISKISIIGYKQYAEVSGAFVEMNVSSIKQIKGHAGSLFL